MSREVRSILGYQASDLMRLTESTSDDIVAAYRELVTAAKAGADFTELTDGVIAFLDVIADGDPDGQVDEKLACHLRQKVMSDEFRDIARSALALMGESRTFRGDMRLHESREEFDDLLVAATNDVKLSRDFTEAAMAATNLIASIKARSPEAAAIVDHHLIEALEGLLVSLDKPLRKLAARLG